MRIQDNYTSLALCPTCTTYAMLNVVTEQLTSHGFSGRSFSRPCHPSRTHAAERACIVCRHLDVAS